MAILGCIADDFTGASDAASFLVKGGMSVQLYNGIPESAADLKPVQAIVIALKSRTQETAQAVADSHSFFQRRALHTFISNTVPPSTLPQKVTLARYAMR